MQINWKVRRKNILFVAQIIASIFVPILGYMGLATEDLTTWTIVGDVLFEAVSNPYVLLLVAISVFNATIDPTTKGIKDSTQALTYTEPK